MNPEIHENNPFRSPQWRSDRVFQLLEHCTRPSPPRHYDDEYVREYRNFVRAYLVAGNDPELQQKAIADRPHLYQAHALYFSQDRQLRQIIEAWLLTTETYGDIAQRLGADDKVVDYFAKLFFDVRDRLQCHDWVAKVIRGTPSDATSIETGVITENQRGILLRLFAYCGGPLVLDAMIATLSPGVPSQQSKDIASWFDDALIQFIGTRAVQAAQALEVNKSNVVSLIKVALRNITSKNRIGANSPDAGEEHARKVLKLLDSDYFQQLFPSTIR